MDWTPETIESIKAFVLKADDISKAVYRIVKPYLSNRGTAELKFLKALKDYYEGDPNADTVDFIDAVIDGWELYDATILRARNGVSALWPGWRLNFYAIEQRKISAQDWKCRWLAAGNACNWVGASKTKFIALRNSPIWKFLGDGAGGYSDTYGLPHPPFVVGNNTDWIEATAEECKRAGITLKKPARTLTLGERQIWDAVRKFGMPKL